MIDAVLSYHTNPLTCGVAKYNRALAARLGVPYLPLEKHPVAHPLISVKTAECDDEWSRIAMWYRQFSLLFHDEPRGVCFDDVVKRATQVLHAKEIGCPSTVEGNPSRGAIDVLSFGMAHKFQKPLFQRLRDLLDDTHESYTVSVSTGIHEGTPWDEGFADNMTLMRDVFGTTLRCLGFLADDGLARMLRETRIVALFYDPAARANNTTLWTALDAGVPVITNLDHESPAELQHNISVYDLKRLTEFPTDAAQHREVRAGGTRASRVYSWDRVIRALRAPVHA